MRFRLEQFLPGPPDAVEAALTDPAFTESLAELPNLGRPELLEQRTLGGRVHQRVRYHFAGELSSAVTRFVDPGKLSWVQVTILDPASHTADFHIEPDHYAGILDCRGRFTLQAEGASTRRTAEGELKVHIPLVGRKAEQAIVSGLVDHARHEADILSTWLLTGQAGGAIPEA